MGVIGQGLGLQGDEVDDGGEAAGGRGAVVGVEGDVVGDIHHAGQTAVAFPYAQDLDIADRGQCIDRDGCQRQTLRRAKQRISPP